MFVRISMVVAACCALSLLGCGPAGTADAGVDAGVDAGSMAEAVNGCTAADFAANDLSAATASRVISFPTTAAPVQYSKPCITVAAGQMVTWNGDFSLHPLEQAGGDPTMWITPTQAGSTVTFPFPVGGTYGFECSFHPTLMRGAIYVK
jgi:plastocyanin